MTTARGGLSSLFSLSLMRPTSIKWCAHTNIGVLVFHRNNKIFSSSMLMIVSFISLFICFSLGIRITLLDACALGRQEKLLHYFFALSILCATCAAKQSLVCVCCGYIHTIAISKARVLLPVCLSFPRLHFFSSLPFC